jgi:hypothetical protein
VESLLAGVETERFVELSEGRVAGGRAAGLDPGELGRRDLDEFRELGESEPHRLPTLLEGAAEDPGIGAGSGAGVISGGGGRHQPGFNCASEVNSMH